MSYNRLRADLQLDEELHQLCKAVHRETGVYLRVTTAEEWASLAGLIRLRCSADIKASLDRLQAVAL